jgi:uncharacterized membrane protein (UPF0127 family)
LLGGSIEVADSSSTRNRGLLGRDSLPEGEGLWITPCEAIHMFFMKFAIDVVFLDKNKRVVKIASRLKPWRVAGSFRARSVLELPAGTAERSGTQVGDQLELIR